MDYQCDKLIRATDGTVRPARLLAQEKLAEVGYVTLVTEWGEPVDCFKSTPIFTAVCDSNS